MIVAWMLYATATTLLLALAAGALEGVTRRHGRPVRGLWLVALAASLLLPLLALLPARPPAEGAPPSAPGAWEAWTGSLQTIAPPARRVDLDLLALSGWATASALAALAVALSYASLLRRRREWAAREVDGHRVWVSPDTGPAVFGFLPGRIVVPEWLLRAPPEERALVLAHEEEHLRAGDAPLLLGALLVAVVLPWNLALWWLWRRLRRAIEIDCDLRVLARGADPRAYGRLLVGITAHGRAHRLAVGALSESASFLERRIRLILPAPSRPAWGRAAGSSALALALVAGACELERPGLSWSRAGVPASTVAMLSPGAAPAGPLAEMMPAGGELELVLPVSSPAAEAAPAPRPEEDGFARRGLAELLREVLPEAEPEADASPGVEPRVVSGVRPPALREVAAQPPAPELAEAPARTAAPAPSAMCEFVVYNGSGAPLEVRLNSSWSTGGILGWLDPSQSIPYALPCSSGWVMVSGRAPYGVELRRGLPYVSASARLAEGRTVFIPLRP